MYVCVSIYIYVYRCLYNVEFNITLATKGPFQRTVESMSTLSLFYMNGVWVPSNIFFNICLFFSLIAFCMNGVISGYLCL